MKKILVILLLFVITAEAQDRYLDSLLKAADKYKNDTLGAKALCNIASKYQVMGDLRSSIRYAFKSIELSQKLNFPKCEASAYANLGGSYMYIGLYDSSLSAHNISFDLFKGIHNTKGMASAYGSMGAVYQNQGKYDKSIAYIKKSIVFCEENGLKEMLVNMYINLANAYYYVGEIPVTLDYLLKALRLIEKEGMDGEEACINNIGIVYAEQKDYPNALKYFERALKINEKEGRKRGISSAYSNISGVYLYSNQLDKALEYGKKAVELDKEVGSLASTANGLGNLAGIYITKQQYDTALKHTMEAYNLYKQMGRKEGIVNMEALIARIYLYTNKVKEAEPYALNSLKVSKEIGLLNAIKEAELALSEIYTKLNKSSQALEHYKEYITARDSLNNSENTREITQKEMNYQFSKEQEKQEIEKEKIEIENALKQKQQRLIIFSVISGLLLVIIFSLFLYKRYRVTQQQNRIIEEQNKEIIDSITYAKRLQDAILPTIDSIKQVLPNSFVLYKPKAIVAGDFYWAEKIGDDYFIAAADSTGHGVPGAMVSVVCSNALNRSVKEFHLTDTGKILDKTRELVLETFEKSSENVKDGMDISLLCINLKTKQVRWSGANNPLWYVQGLPTGQAGKELKEIKADKQPIGLTDSPKPFTSHTIENSSETNIYLFTDGFADQFGGPNGKKFKYKQFSDLLVNNSHLSMPEQMEMINSTFTSWKGRLEQVDDVCVIGIKL